MSRVQRKFLQQADMAMDGTGDEGTWAEEQTMLDAVQS